MINEMAVMYWADSHRTLYHGDCRKMTELPDESVQTIVTSPPYWGLRKYAGLPDLIWGGKEDCRHEWNETIRRGEIYDTKTGGSGSAVRQAGKVSKVAIPNSFCSLCGAWKGQLGLEPTPEMYISHLVEIFREVKKKLRPDGTCFINIGDSYSSLTSSQINVIIREDISWEDLNEIKMELWQCMPEMWSDFGFQKSKGFMPQMLQCAIQERAFTEGKRVTEELLSQESPEVQRQDKKTVAREKITNDTTTWRQMCLLRGNKSNLPLFRPYQGKRAQGLPEKRRTQRGVEESNSGRITKRQLSDSLLELQLSFGDLWLLSSFQFHITDIPARIKKYFKPTEAILKPKDLCLIPFRLAIALQEDKWWVRSVIIWNKPNPMPESVRDRPTESHEYILMLTKSARYYWDAEAVREAPKPEYAGQSVSVAPEREGSLRHDGGRSFKLDGLVGRNLRSVWTFPTHPYKFAHFATYPEKLVEICVKAATPEVGCCSKCGKPWVRVTENKPMVIRRTNRGELAGNRTASSGTMVSPPETRTLGWKQACPCQDADKVPTIVLDPFVGSGTTLKVAAELNRRAIGYELSKEYCDLAIERNNQSALSLGCSL